MNFANFRKALAMLLVLAVVFTVLPPVSVSAAGADWSLSDDTGIFLVKNADTEKDFDALAAQVRLFSSELAEKVTGTALGITYGEEQEAGTHDIILVLDTAAEIDTEGYVVTATDSSIKITASDADGLFYGCRYLIKQLLLDGSVASATDAPFVAERAVSLDNGRKYFTVEWIKELIREMSWTEMNALVLHFSEDMGLGIETKLYPWLNGRDGRLCVQADIGEDYDDRCMTQDEVREIVEYAKLHHIEVIPSLDSPGHMNYIVQKFKEYSAAQEFSFEYDGETYTVPVGSDIGNYYHYNGKTAVVSGSSVEKVEYALNASRGIDISNEMAVAFTRSLIEEYATLFRDLGCTTFDIGGDELLGFGSAVVSTSTASRWQQLDHWKEYAQERTGNSNAVAYDAFLLYMNDLNDLVRELGYTSVRMWNDCALLSSNTGWSGVVQLDTNIDIWFWTTGTNKFATYADAGHKIYNILGDYNYYAMTANYFSDSRTSFAYAYEGQIYNYWNPFEYNIVTDSARDYAMWEDSRVRGGAFGIWCDNPSLRTEEEIMDDVLPLIRANAAKCWYPGANGRVDYDTYTANWEAYGNAPAGTVEAPEVYVIPDLTALEKAVEEFATVDADLYTEESYAAYSEAVEAGKALLGSEKPWQEEVDAAFVAIQAAKEALAEKPKADLTALNEAVSEFETIHAIDYTSESYQTYKEAVAAANTLLAQESYTQAEVDAVLANISAAKNALVETHISETTCILGGSAKSTRVYVNKVATLTVSTDKNADTVSLRVFDENGKEIEATRYALNTKQKSRDIHTFIFKVTEEDRGTHVYTVYAVLSDGTLSADSIQFTIEVS